jgi:hypothetical protein
MQYRRARPITLAGCLSYSSVWSSGAARKRPGRCASGTVGVGCVGPDDRADAADAQPESPREPLRVLAAAPRGDQLVRVGLRLLQVGRSPGRFGCLAEPGGVGWLARRLADVPVDELAHALGGRPRTAPQWRPASGRRPSEDETSRAPERPHRGDARLSCASGLLSVRHRKKPRKRSLDRPPQRATVVRGHRRRGLRCSGRAGAANVRPAAWVRLGRRSEQNRRRIARSGDGGYAYSVSCSRPITLAVSWFKYRPVRAIFRNSANSHEYGRIAAKRRRVARRHSRVFGDVRGDWDRRGTAASAETDRRRTAGSGCTVSIAAHDTKYSRMPHGR